MPPIILHIRMALLKTGISVSRVPRVNLRCAILNVRDARIILFICGQKNGNEEAGS